MSYFQLRDVSFSEGNPIPLASFFQCSHEKERAMITSRLQYFLKVLGSFNTQVDEFLLYKNL